MTNARNSLLPTNNLNKVADLSKNISAALIRRTLQHDDWPTPPRLQEAAALVHQTDAGFALKVFQRPLAAETTSTSYKEFLSKMTLRQRKEFQTRGVVPADLLQHKIVTEEAVRSYLEDLQHAWSKAPAEKVKNLS